MKFSKFIGILFLVISNQAFAVSTEIKLNKKTSIVQIIVKTAQPHNCPNSMKLESRYHGQNHVSVSKDDSNFENLNLVKQNISETCAEEISDYEMSLARLPVCLSFGFSTGTVFVEAGFVNKSEPFKITLADGLVIDSIVQHRQIASSVDEVDCGTEPVSVACCAAMIPSCIACRENASRFRAEWEAACR